MMSNIHSTPDRGSLPIPDNQFAYFTLAAATIRVLPEQHSLVVDRSGGAMTLVDWQSQHFLEQIGFTDQELALLTILMEHWPSYVQYDKLLSLVVENSEVVQRAQTIEDARDGNDQVALDAAIAPLSNILMHCQDRLHRLGLEIGTIKHYGYRIMRFSRMEVAQ